MSYICGRMRNFAFVVCGVLFAVACSAQALPPPEAFGQLPAISQPQLSPDGKHLAAIRAYNGRPAAWIYDLSAPPGTAPIIMPLEGAFIVGVKWAKNDRLLITIHVSVKAGYTHQMHDLLRTMSIDAKAQNPVAMFSNSEALEYSGSTSNIEDIDLDDPDNVYMSLWSNIYKVNVTTGHATRFIEGEPRTYQWIMDGHGKVVAHVEQEEFQFTDHLFFYSNNRWKEVGSYDASGGRSADIMGLASDGGGLVQYAKDKNFGTWGLVELSLPDAKPSPLYFDKKYDVDAALYDPWTERVIGTAYIDDQPRYEYFEPAMRALQSDLEKAFPGNAAHAVSWDVSRNMVVVAVERSSQPPIYYLMNRSMPKITKIADTYPGIAHNDLGEVKAYPYKARDGLDIPAYLTLPPGKTPKNLPTIIMPHGGPMARDWMRFDWMAQFLANRGYAVLQPNFRGSSGYGVMFEEAGYGEWGLKMQDDITDGVQKLIADGVADPKRICIVGASYGGYAALAGAALTPDLYACAAVWAPVTDLREFLSTRKEDYGANSWMISSWTRFIGDRYHDSSKLDAASPAENAARIKCPVLLMHGVADTTVRIDQSEMMQSALEKAGKHVEFIKIDNETHYMNAADTRVRLLKALEAFLAAHLGA